MTKIFACLTLWLIATTAFGASQPSSTLNVVGDLSTYTPKSGEVVWVKGYATPGDWDEPKPFYWDATNALATNDIVRMSSKATGRYVHPWDGDIRAFGVLPGGQFSGDTFSNAMTYGKPIRFAKGIHWQTNDCYTPMGIDVAVYGAANGTTEIRHTVPLGVFIRFSAGYTNSVTVDGFTFEGEADRTSGWEHMLDSPPSYTDWRANTTYKLQAILSSSLAFSSPSSVVVKNCKFLNFIGLPTFIIGAKRVIFSDNFVYKCMDVGFAHCEDVVIANNTFRYGHDNAITLSRQNRRATITGNNIFGQRLSGISISGYPPSLELGSSDVTITGNTVVGSGWAGIHAQVSPNHLTIVGNTVDLPGWFITPDWAHTQTSTTLEPGDTAVTVLDTNHLEVGDWIYLGPLTNNIGELTRITAMSGNDLTIYPPLQRKLYPNADVMFTDINYYDQLTFGIMAGGNDTTNLNYRANNILIAANMVLRYNSLGIVLGERTQTYDGVDNVLVSGNLIGPEAFSKSSSYFLAGSAAVMLRPRNLGFFDVSVIGNQFTFSTNDWETAYAGLPQQTAVTNARFGVIIQGAGSTTNEQWVIRNNVLSRNARAHVNTGTYPYIRHDSWEADVKIENATINDLTVTNLNLINSGLPSSGGSLNTNTYTLSFSQNYYANTPTHPVLITNLVANNVDIGETVVFRNGTAFYTNAVTFQALGSNMSLPGNKDLVLAAYGMVTFLKTHTNLFWCLSDAKYDRMVHRSVIGGGVSGSTMAFVSNYLVHTPSGPSSINLIEAFLAQDFERLIVRNSTSVATDTMTFVNSDWLRCPGNSNMVIGPYGIAEIIKLGPTNYQILNATRWQ